MTTDRELLEKAAKAAGISHAWDGLYWQWNPLTDDGDALRLSVKLRIEIEHNKPQDQHLYVAAYRPGCEMMYAPVNAVEELEDEAQRQEATRRAIVHAAAEIGEGSLTSEAELSKQEPVAWQERPWVALAYARLGAVRDRMDPHNVEAVQEFLGPLDASKG